MNDTLPSPPRLAMLAAKPNNSLYRETLAELIRAGGAEGTWVPPRALEIIALLRQRFALCNETGDAFDRSSRPGDAELFALANELEFWLTF